jgi:hypothetical protein
VENSDTRRAGPAIVEACLGQSAPEPFDPQVLRLYSVLRRQGIDPEASSTAGPGCAVASGLKAGTCWAALTPEQRHAAQAHAVTLVCDPDRSWTFAHETAAAVWGLPRIESWPDAVRTLVVGTRRRGSPGCSSHAGDLAADAEVVHGIRVTPVARTVVDLARSASLPTAVAAADHALRHGLCTRDDLVREADAVPARRRGRPQAALVIDLADGDSMSAGESLSRVQMFRLGSAPAAAAGQARGRAGAHRHRRLRLGRRGGGVRRQGEVPGVGR